MDDWREGQYCVPLCSPQPPSLPRAPVSRVSKLDRLAHLEGLAGCLYNEGQDDLPQDFARAFQCFLVGAWLENLSCQYNVGLWYFKGKGVQQNHYQALRWLRVASQRGHLKARRLLHQVEKNLTPAPKLPQT